MKSLWMADSLASFSSVSAMDFMIVATMAREALQSSICRPFRLSVIAVKDLMILLHGSQSTFRARSKATEGAEARRSGVS